MSSASGQKPASLSTWPSSRIRRQNTDSAQCSTKKLWFSTYGNTSRDSPSFSSNAARVASSAEQRAVLARDPVALGGDLGRRPVDALARLQLLDVAADVAERDLRMVEPDLVVGVEAVAGREVEPRVLGGVVRGPPLVAVLSDLDRELGQLAQLVVGPEQVDLDALDHLRDAEVGDAGEDLLAEAEEVQIRGVAEVEELEVVLPGLVAELDRPVEAGDQAERVVQAPALEHPLLGDDRPGAARTRSPRDRRSRAASCAPSSPAAWASSGSSGRRGPGTAGRARGSPPPAPRPGSCTCSRCGRGSRSRWRAGSGSAACCTGRGTCRRTRP